MRARCRIELVILLALLSMHSRPARGQTATPGTAAADEPSPISFHFGDHPSIHFGDLASVGAMVKFQFDWHRWGGVEAPDGEWEVRMARVGVDGRLFHIIDYQIERELDDDTNPWRDVYVDVAASGALHARGGKFKVPFSLELLTGPMDLDFAYRSLAVSALAPGRDVGGSVHGRLFAKTVRYDAGLFEHSGDNVRASERQSPDSGPMFAFRATYTPWRNVRKSRLRDLTFGGGVTSGAVPEGLNSLNGRTVADEAFFPKVYVNGTRRRFGADVEWRTGPLGVRGELIGARDERRGQGTDDNDLPSLHSDGGYASGTWIVTGEKKTDTIRPRRPLFRGGPGAVEVGARLEWLGFGTGGGGEASGGPRAAYLPDWESRVLTLGVNWYLNRFVRVQVNALYERRRDGNLTLTPAPLEQTSWSPVFRVQFGL